MARGDARRPVGRDRGPPILRRAWPRTRVGNSAAAARARPPCVFPRHVPGPPGGRGAPRDDARRLPCGRRGDGVAARVPARRARARRRRRGRGAQGARDAVARGVHRGRGRGGVRRARRAVARPDGVHGAALGRAGLRARAARALRGDPRGHARPVDGLAPARRPRAPTLEAARPLARRPAPRRGRDDGADRAAHAARARRWRSARSRSSGHGCARRSSPRCCCTWSARTLRCRPSSPSRRGYRWSARRSSWRPRGSASSIWATRRSSSAWARTRRRPRAFVLLKRAKEGAWVAVGFALLAALRRPARRPTDVDVAPADAALIQAAGAP